MAKAPPRLPRPGRKVRHLERVATLLAVLCNFVVIAVAAYLFVAPKTLSQTTLAGGTYLRNYAQILQAASKPLEWVGAFATAAIVLCRASALLEDGFTLGEYEWATSVKNGELLAAVWGWRRANIAIVVLGIVPTLVQQLYSVALPGLFTPFNGAYASLASSFSYPTWNSTVEGLPVFYEVSQGVSTATDPDLSDLGALSQALLFVGQNISLSTLNLGGMLAQPGTTRPYLLSTALAARVLAGSPAFASVSAAVNKPVTKAVCETGPVTDGVFYSVSAKDQVFGFNGSDPCGLNGDNYEYREGPTITNSGDYFGISTVCMDPGPDDMVTNQVAIYSLVFPPESGAWDAESIPANYFRCNITTTMSTVTHHFTKGAQQWEYALDDPVAVSPPSGQLGDEGAVVATHLISTIMILKNAAGLDPIQAVLREYDMSLTAGEYLFTALVDQLIDYAQTYTARYPAGTTATTAQLLGTGIQWRVSPRGLRLLWIIPFAINALLYIAALAVGSWDRIQFDITNPAQVLCVARDDVPTGTGNLDGVNNLEVPLKDQVWYYGEMDTKGWPTAGFSREPPRQKVTRDQLY